MFIFRMRTVYSNTTILRRNMGAFGGWLGITSLLGKQIGKSLGFGRKRRDSRGRFRRRHCRRRPSRRAAIKGRGFFSLPPSHNPWHL